MCWFDMIKSKTRWRRIISVVINIRDVTIVIYSKFCGLQMTKRIGEVSGISAKRNEKQR